MANKKLSQIVPATLPVAITDTVVGVQNATTDVLYTLGDVFPVKAAGNINYYVDPAGSDSNLGTSGSPFATVQHAANVAALTDGQNLYTVTINLAAGTFTVTAPITLPQLRNTSAVITGAGSTSIVFNSTAFSTLFQASGENAVWTIQNITADGSGTIFQASNLANVRVRNLTTTDRTASAQSVIFVAASGGTMNANFTTINVNSPFLQFLGIGGSEALFLMIGATLNLPSSVFGTPNVNEFLSNQGSGTAFVEIFGSTINNAGNFQGTQAQLIATGGCSVFTANGAVSDIPGVATDNIFDQTVFWGNAIAGVLTGVGAVQGSGLPTTSVIPSDGFWLVYKDTSGGGVYVAYNDGGTIKKVALV